MKKSILSGSRGNKVVTKVLKPCPKRREDGEEEEKSFSFHPLIRPFVLFWPVQVTNCHEGHTTNVKKKEMQ